MPEVQVPVEEDEAIATHAPEAEQRPKQDAAIAAQHERGLAPGDDGLHAIGEAAGVGGARRLVADGLAVPVGEVARRGDDAAIPRREARDDPLVAQGAGQLVHPRHGAGGRGAQAEIRRRIHDDERPAHALPPLSSKI